MGVCNFCFEDDNKNIVISIEVNHLASMIQRTSAPLWQTVHAISFHAFPISTGCSNSRPAGAMEESLCPAP